MIEIVGTELNQWDVGRLVHITGVEAEYAHFANKGDSKAVIMGVVDIEAKIPDYLLQTGKPLCVYAVKDGITIESKTFYVKIRERPENYVYESDQRNYIYELITNAETAIGDANLATESANKASADAILATENANKSATSAKESSDSANIAAKNANDAAFFASHTAKNLMVVGEAKGTNISLDDAIEQYLVGLRIFGKSTQDGTPTPDAPVDIVSVGGGSITVNVAGDNKSQSVTIATPNGLPGIPVASGGNYTDEDGQQWVCDEIDFAKGVRIKRIRVIVLNGSSSTPWKALGSVGESYRFTFTLADIAPKTKLICDHFAYQGDIPTSGVEGIYAHGTANTPSILIAKNRIADSEIPTWKAYLAENPIKVVYQLATPIETPLSEEELAAYANLQTYRGNTTVSNDAGAYMELEYVMDAKTYINRLVASMLGK